mgnify:CR=1 FL=1
MRSPGEKVARTPLRSLKSLQTHEGALSSQVFRNCCSDSAALHHRVKKDRQERANICNQTICAHFFESPNDSTGGQAGRRKLKQYMTTEEQARVR